MSDKIIYDVFLSHSSKDKAIVRDIAERLRKDGIKVWFDEWALRPGDSIPSKIEEGLELSRVLVLCMSANAFGSDWAQLEAGTFRFRDPLNKKRRFVPLQLDDTPVKGALAQFHHIKWNSSTWDQEYERFLEACRADLIQPSEGCVSEETQRNEQLFQEHLARHLPQRTGLLMPGNKATPEYAKQLASEVAFVILMGADCMCFANKFPHVVINQMGENMIVIGNDGNTFWLDAKMFSEDGRIIAEITRNIFTINDKNCFRCERSPNGLVVYNDEARPIIDLELLNPTCASLRGNFYLRHGVSVSIGDGFKLQRGRTKSGNITMQSSSFGTIRV